MANYHCSESILLLLFTWSPAFAVFTHRADLGVVFRPALGGHAAAF